MRVCVVGVGSIGERHVRCFLATGRVSVAIVETKDELREAIAQKYQVPAFTSLEQAIEWRPDLAVVATPAPLHIPMARQFVASGIHVLIEKPLSTSLDGAEALIHEAEQRRVRVGVAYVYRSYELFQAVKRVVDQQRFGRPLQIVAATGQHFPTYRPAYREIYYRDRAQGGGAIQDALTHVLNLGEWLVGPIDRLAADAAHLALPGVEVEDTVHVMTRHGNVLGSYAMNQFQAPNEMTLTIHCERGTVRVELHRNRWSWMEEISGQWQHEPGEAFERDQPFTVQANAMLDAIAEQKPLLCTLEEGLQTLRVNLAVLAAAEQQSWQAIQR